MTDDFETIQCFPTSIHVVKKPEFLKTVLPIVDEYIGKRKREQGKTNDIYPVYMTDHLFEDPRLEEFCSYIGGTAWNILREQGYDMSRFSTTFTEMWAQHHYKYSGMDQHVHPYGSQLVGFYFLRSPPNCSVATFFDPRPGKVQNSLPEHNFEAVTDAANAFHVMPEEGNLVFTNSWLPHAFTKNGSEDPMTFIHFNIAVTVNDEPVCDVEVI
ncbi:Conserved hypothetical protein CHP02466 [uncultured Caudovirales phage]|uniref:Uncharacterized protein n=1 Tax=uncultured Caudovirales phage TaxID=2100421 RepID=A0A6J5NYQ2_9CAUD|nr:Conserved hypothetical protein CHP02466 [uncultured Caudovirales phage]